MPWCSNLQVLSSICSGNIILSYFCFFFIADLLNLKTGNHEKLSETTKQRKDTLRSVSSSFGCRKKMGIMCILKKLRRENRYVWYLENILYCIWYYHPFFPSSFIIFAFILLILLLFYTKSSFSITWKWTFSWNFKKYMSSQLHYVEWFKQIA